MQHYHAFQLDWNNQIVGKHELICAETQGSKPHELRHRALAGRTKGRAFQV